MNEYSPAPEHRKIFNLTPAADDVTLTAIRARTECLRDSKLPYGARVLFCFLLDMALNPYVYVAKGVVAISATRLSEYLGCYDKTVFIWIKKLEAGRHLWSDKQFMPNFWAMNRYHITAFDAQDAPSQLPTRDGMWGNGYRKGNAWGQEQIAARVAEKALAAGGAVVKTTRQIAGENLHLAENQPPASGKTTLEPSPEPPARRVENPPAREVEKPPAREVENPPAADVENPPAAQVVKKSPGAAKTTHIRESQLRVGEKVKREGNPPPDAFACKIKGMFPSKLEKLATKLVWEINNANSVEAKKEWKRRYQLVKDEILGGKVEDSPVPLPKPARKAPAPAKAPTHEELLEGARYLVQIGRDSSLTEGQRAALKAAGEDVR